VHVQNVLRSILTPALPVNENLLSQEADRICDLNLGREALGLKLDGPWMIQEYLHVPQVLRGHASDFRCRFPPLLAVVSAANQWRQELRVESGALPTQPVVSYGWAIVTEELLCKAMIDQSRANVLSPDVQLGWYCNVHVKCAQGRVIQLLRFRVHPLELVRPATDDYQLVKPRRECGNQFFESGGS
jgi:hypothetical protein